MGHFSLMMVAPPDILPLNHDFRHPGPQKWRSTPHDVTIFSLFFFFFGCAKNLEICEAAKDSSRASSKKREKKEHLNWDSLRVALWHNCPLNVASEGCRPWFETHHLTDISIPIWLYSHRCFGTCLMIYSPVFKPWFGLTCTARKMP